MTGNDNKTAAKALFEIFVRIFIGKFYAKLGLFKQIP